MYKNTYVYVHLCMYFVITSVYIFLYMYVLMYVYVYKCECMYVYIRICVFLCMFIYTVCPRRNVSDFGRVFLILKYTDITQNTCVKIWTFTEIMSWDKYNLHAGPHTVLLSWQSYPFLTLSVVSYDGNSAHARHRTARVLPSVCSAVYRNVVNGW